MLDDLVFHGEVLPSEIGIDGHILSEHLNLTAGQAQFPGEPWLKFTLDGKTIYLAKKPLRYALSWDQLNEVGAVDGSATIARNGKSYRVRLLRGTAKAPGINEVGFDTPSTHGSEWNRIMYRIHNGKHTDPKNKTNSNPLPKLANYGDDDLLLYPSFGHGSRCWCADSVGDNYRVIRGYSGVSNLYRELTSALHIKSGWRPVLELIEE